MRKIGKVLYGCVPTILSITIMFVVVFAGTMVVSMVVGVRIGMGQSDSLQFSQEQITKDVMGILMHPNTQLLLNYSVMFLLMVVFAIWYQIGFVKGRFSVRNITEGCKKVFSVKSIVLYIILGILIQVIVSVILEFILPMFPKILEDYVNLIESIGVGNTFWAWGYTIIMAPIAEELIFRGVTFGIQKKAVGFTLANVIQALLFGIYHRNIVQFTYAFALGLLLGYICHAFESILPAILLHAAVNLFANVFEAIGFWELFTNAWMLIAFAVVCTVVFLFVIRALLSEREKRVENNMFL